LTGIVVAIFDSVTNFTLWAFFSNFFAAKVYAIFPIVVAGLLISGLLLKWSSTPSGSGTEEVVKAYNEENGRMDSKSFLKKMLAAVVTIGLGGSAGQEGPSVYAGGAMGSWLWTKLKWRGLDSDDRRIMLLAGAAAGIGAVFKAPLTGIVFALEVPFKDDLAHDALVPSMVASVTSYLVLISVDGAAPLFQFAGVVDIAKLSLVDMATAAVLAAICGLCALVFIWAYKNITRTLLQFFPRFYFRALIGGIVVSSIGILSVWMYKEPYPLGLSYNLIKLALSQNSLSTTLLVLFGMKLVATSFTMGSTGDGGIFIPQIVMGAAIGGAFAQIVAPSQVDLFVAVGMASFLAAGYKTPLASVTFVAETTASPGYLIPSLIAAAISYSITGEASVSDHQKLRNEIDVTQIAHLKASDVMTKRVIAVPADVSVLDFVEEYLFVFQHKRFPVVDKEGLVGIISAAEIKDVPREKWFETKIIDVCNRNYRVAYADSDLQKIMDLMVQADIGRVPIVDRSRPTKMVGIVSKADIIRALERERTGSA
jgi:CIC family chloride channel protein